MKYDEFIYKPQGKHFEYYMILVFFWVCPLEVKHFDLGHPVSLTLFNPNRN